MRKTKIKICGITNIEDALFCEKLGADYLGFITYPKSPRYISLENIKTIMPKIHVKKVGVFVNEKIENIPLDLFDVIQLHGDEDEKYIENLRKVLPKNVEIWKALRVQSKKNKNVIFPKNADKYLLDTFDETNYGGTGKVFDWQILDELNIPKDKIILSGGIGVENIEKAVKCGVFAVDANSKLEAKPGKKDEKKVKEFFELV